jgi:RNA polymerase sigma-70 factor, ECF subfamily
MLHGNPTPNSDRASVRSEEEEAHAFGQLVRANYGRLCNFVFHYVGSADAAEDVVQDTLVKVWRRRQQLDFDRPLAYLYQAVRNEAISHRRRQGVRQRVIEEIGQGDRPMAPDSGRLLERADLATAVAAAVDALPERCRLIFTMHREQGLTYAQIAEALGLSVKTVETQISRAFRALRTRLADYLVLAVILASAGSRVA